MSTIFNILRTCLLQVTVHSVPSNTLRDAHKMLFHNILALLPSGFPQKHAETPCGTVACEQ